MFRILVQPQACLPVQRSCKSQPIIPHFCSHEQNLFNCFLFEGLAEYMQVTVYLLYIHFSFIS